MEDIDFDPYDEMAFADDDDFVPDLDDFEDEDLEDKQYDDEEFK